MTGGLRRWLRGLGCAAVVAVGLVWTGAGLAGWHSERLAASLEAGRSRPEAGLAAPAWADAPPRAAARRLLARGLARDLALADVLLERSARARPLYAPTWLARAELDLRSGRPEQAARHAALAAQLWPHRPRLLWRVAVLRAQLGDRAGALDALCAYLRAEPTRVLRAAWLARRLESDPEILVERLASAAAPGVPVEEHLIALLGASVGHPDPALARTIWARLPPPARRERGSAALYAEALLQAGAVDEAVAAWAHVAGDEIARSGLTDPGFEEPPQQGGLGWRIRSVPGLEWTRDAQVRHGGDFSLRIALTGAVDPGHWSAVQLVPVEPGAAYRLAFYWRGRELPGRSGPYVEVASRRGERPLRVSAPPRGGSWDWRRVEIGFVAPEATRLVELRIRRDPDPTAGPRVKGCVWIDDVDLRPLRPETVRG